MSETPLDNAVHSGTIHIDSDKQYLELKSQGCVVVQYSAIWCGPCRAIAPAVDKLAQSTPNVKFLHVNVEEQAELEDVATVGSLPTFKFFKDGLLVSEFAGASLARLEATILQVFQ